MGIVQINDLDNAPNEAKVIVSCHRIRKIKVTKSKKSLSETFATLCSTTSCIKVTKYLLHCKQFANTSNFITVS